MGFRKVSDRRSMPASTAKVIFENTFILENSRTIYDVCNYAKKNCYSYAQAKKMIRALIACPTRNNNKVFLRPYKCRVCGKWHLTSQKVYERPDAD